MAPRAEDFAGIILRGPTNRKPMNTVYDWLEGKKIDDGAEGLWRVHDKLYDLTSWMGNHPGGRGWLEITKGTDITEAFECHHITDKAEKILKMFYVRDAKTPRNSLLTFHENGFFKTFRRKINERNLLANTEPLLKTKILADSLAVSVFLTGYLAMVHSLWWAVFSGILLNMLTVCSHNFFHMKDNWRMYYLNMLLMSVREWRISHVLSHHFYPNTVLDLEISMFEPLFQFLPKEEKKFRFASVIFAPIVMATGAHFQFLRRIISTFTSQKLLFGAEELVSFVIFFFLLVTGGQSVWETFIVWNVILLSGSFSFFLVGLTAAHHHPNIYHEGDFLGSDKDFGLFQLATVRNRIDVDGNFVKTMVMFGQHALHHMFPTVDHARLITLSHLLDETCKEFNIEYKPLAVKNLFVGMFQQLVRNYINSRLMILGN